MPSSGKKKDACTREKLYGFVFLLGHRAVNVYENVQCSHKASKKPEMCISSPKINFYFLGRPQRFDTTCSGNALGTNQLMPDIRGSMFFPLVATNASVDRG